jgi:hypothetical protein
MEEKPLSRRSIAARANGRKGGQATARNHSPEWLSKRGQSGGSTTRDLYSADFFRHAQGYRKVRRGWPQGKLRKAADKALQVVRSSGLSDEATAALTNMLVQG